MTKGGKEEGALREKKGAEKRGRDVEENWSEGKEKGEKTGYCTEGGRGERILKRVKRAAAKQRGNRVAAEERRRTKKCLQ